MSPFSTPPFFYPKYFFSADATLKVKKGQSIKPRQPLIKERRGDLSLKEIGISGDQEEKIAKKPINGGQIVMVTGSDNEKRVYRFSRDASLNVRNKENIGQGTSLIGLRSAECDSEIAGTVNVETLKDTGEQIVRVQPLLGDDSREYKFSRFERLSVKTGDSVKKGQPLIHRSNTLGSRFRWRVRPIAFLREMVSKLDEKYAWVNLSDGGHLENMATIELLRRRCKYIIIGDGEADPDLHFHGLATLIRTAFIDLGIEIDINLDEIRLQEHNGEQQRNGEQDIDEEGNGEGVSKKHWAIGQIAYPIEGTDEVEHGYLLYLKSSFTGDEGEVIREYRHRNPDFPHQSTADQFFDEGQFEAYRALGQHICEKAFGVAATNDKMRFKDFEDWIIGMWENRCDNQKENNRTTTRKTPVKRTSTRTRKKPEA